ncbi:MAG: PDZ domain-containing protein [Deltaproteobacteria bacterium]|nr:PDZ domain-containing protein [Deltaproteobacteria bacterium]
MIALVLAGLVLAQPDESLADKPEGLHMGVLYCLQATVGCQEGRGAPVRYVWRSSPAFRAGLRDGDLVVRFNEEDVRDVAAARTAWNRLPKGSCARLEVLRPDERVALPCIPKVLQVDLSADRLIDAAWEEAPYVDVEGAVRRPGTYLLKGTSVAEILRRAVPAARVEVCQIAFGPRARGSGRKCGDASVLEGLPIDRSYFVSVRDLDAPPAPACGVLPDVALSEIYLGMTSSSGGVVFGAPNDRKAAGRVGDRLGRECARIAEVTSSCVILEMPARTTMCLGDGGPNDGGAR